MNSILIEVSNVRVDGKGRRYRQGWESRTISSNEVFQAFYHRTTEMAEDLAVMTAQPRAAFTLLKGVRCPLDNDSNAQLKIQSASRRRPNIQRISDRLDAVQMKNLIIFADMWLKHWPVSINRLDGSNIWIHDVELSQQIPRTPQM